ncbi:MAG TPA: mechanosensitive ion channel family protein [Nitrospiraceae bacterium]|jgi:small-conductance mechanosensitive channel|nr:mechanosensitive ion channel family protein [Nitrospiraceae bacterium]
MNLGFLLVKIVLTTAGLIAVVVGLAYLARRREKRLPPAVFIGAGITAVLADAALVFTSGVAPSPPEAVLNWIEVGAYCGASFLLLKAIDVFIIGDYLIGRKGTYIPDVVRTLILFTGLTAATLVILRLVMNINVIALVALPTVATAVVGVALRDTLVRFFSGIALGKMVRVGDWISVLDREGLVTDIGFGHVTLLTREQDYVALPNNTVIQAGLINYSRPTTVHICSVTVEAAYRTPPSQVCAVLVETVLAVEGVLSEPRPVALVSSFNDSGVQYRVRFAVNDYSLHQSIESQVRAYVWNAFQRNGIEIPFPQRVVHTQTGTAPEQMSRQSDQIVSHLAAVDFLAVLAPEQIEVLARDATIQRYLPGECVVRQGEAGQELYVILEGTADVRIRQDGRSLTVATLQKGQFFGEMSLLTGEPRTATVVARTPLRVVAVGKQGLSRVAQEDGRVIDLIGEVVARRQLATAVAKEQLAKEGVTIAVVNQTRSLTERIRRFLWGGTPA